MNRKLEPDNKTSIESEADKDRLMMLAKKFVYLKKSSNIRNQILWQQKYRSD